MKQASIVHVNANFLFKGKLVYDVHTKKFQFELNVYCASYMVITFLGTPLLSVCTLKEEAAVLWDCVQLAPFDCL